MNDTTTVTKAKWPLIVALAGPISWPVMALIAWMASRGPDGGWSGMAAMFSGLAIILIVHIVPPIILIVLAVSRKRKGMKAGSVPKWGLAYYGLVACVARLLQGPSEFLRDASTLLKRIFTGT